MKFSELRNCNQSCSKWRRWKQKSFALFSTISLNVISFEYRCRGKTEPVSRLWQKCVWLIVRVISHVKLSKSLIQLFLKQTEPKLSNVHCIPAFLPSRRLGLIIGEFCVCESLFWHRLQLLDELMYIFSLPLVKTFIFVIKNGLKDFWHDAIHLQKFRLNHSPLSPQPVIF